MQTIVSLNMFSILNVRHEKLDFAQPLKGNRDSDTAVRDRELHFLRIETPRIAENKMIKTNTYNSIYNQCSTTFRNEDNSLCCNVVAMWQSKCIFAPRMRLKSSIGSLHCEAWSEWRLFRCTCEVVNHISFDYIQYKEKNKFTRQELFKDRREKDDVLRKRHFYFVDLSKRSGRNRALIKSG